MRLHLLGPVSLLDTTERDPLAAGGYKTICPMRGASETQLPDLDPCGNLQIHDND